MPNHTSTHLNNSPAKGPLIKAEIIFLSLLIAVLPIFEAPKHLFWALYFITALSRVVITQNLLKWKAPDFLFALWIISALATSIWPGMPGHDEWKGFKDLFVYSSTGWLIYRSDYSKEQLSQLLITAVLATIPALIWGLWLHLGPAHKQFLELKSVGHVNHSAIYLVIIFGVSLSAALTNWGKLNLIKRLIIVSITGLLFWSIVIGQSRAALGITIPLSCCLFLLLGTHKKIKWLGMGLIAMALAGIMAINPIILQKHQSNVASKNTLSYRSEVWNVSLEAAKWHPRLGLGMNNWKFITPNQIKQSVEQNQAPYDPKNYFYPGHSHNLYLTVLVERGYLGLGVLILVLLSWGWQLLKTRHQCHDNQSLLLWGSSLSTYITVIGIGMVNTTVHHEHGLLTALCLGALLSYTSSKNSA